MSTQAQIEANHRNAQKSTGPKTEQGKATAARNAVKHGIFCQHLILPGESEEELQTLRSGIYKRLRPADELEKLYVERIVVAAWKIRRLLATEADAYEETRDVDGNLHPVPHLTSVESERQQKLIASLERAMDKAMSELTKFQKNRPEDLDDPAPIAIEENKPNSSQPVAGAPVFADAVAEPSPHKTNPSEEIERSNSMKTNPISVQPITVTADDSCRTASEERPSPT